MKFLQSISGHRRSLLRALGPRHFAASAEQYASRNYASNESEYNTVIGSVTAQRKHYLLRDVYDDMLLDGVKPERDTFHSLIIGTMKGSRLQDAFFFRDEMKSMGLVPDAALYNFLISTCGKCNNSDQATRILEEMKKFEVKPTGQTFICLLNAYAAAGRLDRVYAIVRDMTAAGLGLNKFCYAGLIAAHRNKIPVSKDTANKIIELVEQSKGWSSAEESRNSSENFMMGISEEELYNIPTAEYINRRGGFLNKQFTVYHVAFHAFADLTNIEVDVVNTIRSIYDGMNVIVCTNVAIQVPLREITALSMVVIDICMRNESATETLLEMLKKDGKTPDVFIVMHTMRCYLHSGDIDRGLKTFEDYMNSGKPAMVELYVTLIEGAMVGYTSKGMQLAQDTLANMTSRRFFLSPKMGNDLLLAASGEKTGGYTTANMIWDLMQARKLIPLLPAVEAYYNGLKEREIPEDDPRLLLVSRTLDNVRLRTGSGPRRS